MADEASGTDDKAPGTDPESTLENPGEPARTRLLDLALKAAAAGVSITGVALVGQAVAWTRFEAADLPANQAIVVLGQAERIAIGGITLALFLVIGALAVAGVYILDRKAEPENKATRYGLGLLMVAGVIGGSLRSLGGSWEFWCVLGLVLATFLGMVLLTGNEEERTRRWTVRFALVALLAALLSVPGWISDGRAWFPLLFLGVVLLLGGLCLGIAGRTGTVFRWYGVAVFLSVVIFGAVVTVARTFNTPKVQPIAVLVKDGTAVDGTSGIYIADSSDRVYVGSVELDGDEVEPGSGAIFWIPCERVLTYAVGSFQEVPGALEDAETLLQELRNRPVGAPAELEAEDVAETAVSLDQEADDTADESQGSCKS